MHTCYFNLNCCQMIEREQYDRSAARVCGLFIQINRYIGCISENKWKLKSFNFYAKLKCFFFISIFPFLNHTTTFIRFIEIIICYCVLHCTPKCVCVRPHAEQINSQCDFDGDSKLRWSHRVCEWKNENSGEKWPAIELMINEAILRFYFSHRIIWKTNHIVSVKLNNY